MPKETDEKSNQDDQKYKKVDHKEPVKSADGRTEYRSSEVTYSGPADNPRNTKEGRAADQAARGDTFKTTGMDAGHKHGVSQGVDPSDKENISPQNSLQNRGGGTWNNMERARDRDLKNDPNLKIKETVTERYDHDRPGYGDKVPISRQAVHERSDGTVTGQNVHYGNFQSSASRRANELQEQGKSMEPGEAGKLHDQDRQNLKGHGKAHLTEEGREQQAEWRQMQEQHKSAGSMSSEDRAAMKDKMREHCVEGGKSKEHDMGRDR
jgi:hypothetical protein